jgi:ribosomal protein S18 acetylase RimI-like enzyme
VSVPPRVARRVTTRDGTQVELAHCEERDHDALFRAFSRIVADGEGWPEHGEYARSEFERTWVEVPTEVTVARVGDELAGAYLVKPNFVGRAAHIANCGYFVDRDWRGRGIGELLVQDSIERARACGFDAIMFNLVFESNPARALYERLGWKEIGRIPSAVDGEDCILYWRALT